MYRIESLLSGRLFLVPQLVGEKIYFVSNLSGRLSLYVMDKGGSVPVPLLPPEIALQNPHIIGRLFYVFPKARKILLLIDRDGNEDNKPMFIPLDGGYPEPAFSEGYEEHRFFLGECFSERDLVYIGASSHKEPINHAYQLNIGTGALVKMHTSKYGAGPNGFNHDHSRAALVESYSTGDHVLYDWKKGQTQGTLLYGKPMDDRGPEDQPEYNSIQACFFIQNEQHLLFFTTLFADTGGLGTLDLAAPEKIVPASLTGMVHAGSGEFLGLEHLDGDRYLARFNIDGADWAYEGVLDEAAPAFHCQRVLVGQGELSDGVLEHIHYDKTSDCFSLSFSTAVSPTQIYTLEGPDRKLVRQTNEKLLGLKDGLLSKGEDYSFASHDGLRVSARLYLPAEELGFAGPRPVVYYIHGGPQSQERPDFAWFSMPIIQFLTLNGFAVFVPNVRGSTGYGLKYVKHVDRDWGGQDRLDHVHAMTKVLPKDSRMDVNRTAVVGRSYGGYMTLMLAGRHPELWKASCDMFGPYDLFTFLDRIPQTWKPYFYIALGDPEKDKDLLRERSPRTHIENIGAPMLVIQGKNDPRVVERESHDLVDYLNSIGKSVDYLMFDNEGHDVLKFENRVRCYNAITDFFKEHLRP